MHGIFLALRGYGALSMGKAKPISLYCIGNRPAHRPTFVEPSLGPFPYRLLSERPRPVLGDTHGIEPQEMPCRSLGWRCGKQGGNSEAGNAQRERRVSQAAARNFPRPHVRVSGEQAGQLLDRVRTHIPWRVCN